MDLGPTSAARKIRTPRGRLLPSCPSRRASPSPPAGRSIFDSRSAAETRPALATSCFSITSRRRRCEARPDVSTPLSPTAREIQEQIESNTSAVDHFSSFAVHRQHMTALALRDVAPEAGLRLCILGAGNCYDVDLVKLASSYREIHLVDVDPAALARARQPLGADAGAKVFSHAPLDLSGLFDRLDRWARLEVEPQKLLGHAAEASAQIARSLPGPFDVVISACLLSQIQLAIYNVLSAAHPLFDAVRHIVNLTHLRTLAGLMAPG